MSDGHIERGFGYWLSIFANLAVVAGIVFLGVEIRQNSEMMKAQIRNDITQNVFANVDRSPDLTIIPSTISSSGKSSSPLR
jgi:hypothetical protein